MGTGNAAGRSFRKDPQPGGDGGRKPLTPPKNSAFSVRYGRAVYPAKPSRKTRPPPQGDARGPVAELARLRKLAVVRVAGLFRELLAKRGRGALGFLPFTLRARGRTRAER